MLDNKNIKVSIAIPTYNSSKYLYNCIKALSNFKTIDEIIVHDDHSSTQEFENIKKITEKFSSKLNIKIYRNEINIGAYKNKYKNIEKCNNEIVYQIDSDNIVSSDLDKVVENIYKENDENYLYLPSEIIQFRKYPKLAKILSKFNKKYKVTYTKDDFIFDKGIFQKAIRDEHNFTIDKNINWILNSGNFIVNKSKFIKIMKNGFNSKERYQMDAVAISFFWIEANGKIKTLKDLKHFHRKRQDSVSFVESEGSYEFLQDIRSKFLDL